LESGKTPNGIAISPDGRSVYVADDYLFGGVSEYDVGPGGLLSAKTPKTVVAGKNPESIAISPDGTSVYVTNHQGESISQYDVGPGGVLSAKAPEAVPTPGSVPAGIALSPDGRNAYVADAKGFVLQFSVGAGGALSPLSPAKVAAGTAPIALAVSPEGKSVYVANFTGGEGNGSISQFDVGAGGLLSPKTPATVESAPKPVGVAVSPDGRSVYVTGGEVNGSVSQYDAGPGGALSPKVLARVPAGQEPVGVALSPDGRSLYTADLHGYLDQFDVDAAGALSAKTPAFVLAGKGSPAEPDEVAISPDQGPRATFSALSAPAGSPSTFDASASSDPDGTVVRYDWEFGDGTTAANGGPRPSHAYAAAGSYAVRLQVTDDAGCSATLIFTGQTASCVGGPQAIATATTVVPAGPVSVGAARSVAQPPVITGASLSNRRFRVASSATAISARRTPLGTRFRFTLSAAATVRIAISRLTPGLRRGRSCLIPTARLRRKHAPSCTRALLIGTLTRSGQPAAADTVAFSGRIGRRALRPHAYRAILTATDAAGTSRAVVLPFTVLR
jgi:DNA-binding beta-propeller fold protein YncE